jgi:hypothetical protein
MFIVVSLEVVAENLMMWKVIFMLIYAPNREDISGSGGRASCIDVVTK